MTNQVAIIGSTGYTGAELVRILATHPNIQITTLTSRQYSGVDYSTIYPAMRHVIDLTCETFDPDKTCQKAEIFFLALPHQLSMEIAAKIAPYGKKIIDLSADFRFKDPDIYAVYYQPHKAPDLLKQSVYGLSEIYTDQIAKASLIGNPGCYPTSILLPLIPLIREKLIECHSIIADSKSGVSGAGKGLSLASHFCEVNEGFKAYKIGVHRHAPEINTILSFEAGHPIHITFVPHLVPMTRGILSTLYVQSQSGITENKLRDCLISFYHKKSFVRILPESQFPNTLYVKGSNYCDIGLKLNSDSKQLIIVSAIDNLVKGAAGQAVQNMNIMMDLPDTTGLNVCPSAI